MIHLKPQIYTNIYSDKTHTAQKDYVKYINAKYLIAFRYHIELPKLRKIPQKMFILNEVPILHDSIL